MEEVLTRLFDAVVNGDSEAVSSNLQSALDANLDPIMILNDGMVAAMHEVGCRFEAGDYYVPEMLVAARAMQRGMAILKPHLQQAGGQPGGRVLIGTVKGDLHDIGKNLTALMLEGAGFEIRDLGVDVPVQDFVRAAQEEAPDIVAMSAMLTTTMPVMKEVIEAFVAAGWRDRVKIIVGGAALTGAYAAEIGADGFSPDASRAVNLVKSLLGA